MSAINYKIEVFQKIDKRYKTLPERVIDGAGNLWHTYLVNRERGSFFHEGEKLT